MKETQMKTLTDNEIGMAMLHLRDAEFSEACKQMDDVNNLNYDSMAVRCAGYKAARLAFALGVKHAEAQLKATVEAAEKLGRMFDNWYGESEHLGELTDLMKSEKAGAYEAKEQVLRLTSLLNASIHFNNLIRVETPED